MRTLLLTFILLAGCSYSHPTKNQDDFNKDITACRSMFAGAHDDVFFGDWVRQCMASKGWSS